MNRYYFKHILITSLVVISAFGALVCTSGCGTKCGSTTCQNSGTCVDNVCSCPTGYVGTSCETLASTQYLGSYTCSQTCAPPLTGTASWKSTITADATNSSYTLDISNFGNLNVTVVATVDANNNITLTDASGVAGSGVFANNIMTIHFTTATNNVPGSDCNLTMVKD